MSPDSPDRSPSVVVWAPGHDELDRRVNRVIEVLGQLGAHITVVYDAACAGRIGLPIVPAAKIRLLTGGQRGMMGAILGMRKWLLTLDEPVDLLYIHDSGLFGLMLAILAVRHRRGIRIVFDYHDWIPWEIWYQWSKLVRWDPLACGLTRLTRHLILPLLGSAVSFRGVVGISPGQLDGLKAIIPTMHRARSIFIPNTRSILPDLECQIASGPLILLWVGNVMEGRDLERLLDYTEALRRDEPHFEFSVFIVGKVLSERMLRLLNKILYVQHVPGFTDDGHLREIISHTRAVGIFLGWNDTAGTGINQVASPNKIYSYLNIGIPVIYANSLKAVAQVIPKPGGLPVNDYSDFRQSVLFASAEYASCVASVRLLRSRLMWDSEAKARLASFLSDCLLTPARPNETL